MTSNVGTQFAHQDGSLGFLRSTEGPDVAETHRQIERELKNTFRPEFLNRVDEIIIFSNLTIEDVERIVDLQMKEIEERLADQGLRVELTEAARAWLAHEGFAPQYGARPLRRALQRYIESPLSIQLLHGDFARGDNVLVDLGEAGLVFQKRPSEPIGEAVEATLPVLSETETPPPN